MADGKVDNANVYYSVVITDDQGNPPTGNTGLILRNIMNFRADPAGADVTVRRTINKSRKPQGRRRGQQPHFTLTFDVDVTRGAQEFDWTLAYKRKWKLMLTERRADETGFTQWLDTEVDDVNRATDEAGNVTMSITATALEELYVH